MADDVAYTERLWPPVSWWAVVLVLLGTLAVAVGYPLGLLAGVLTMVVGTVVAVWLLTAAGAGVLVTSSHLTAGRATLPLTVVSAVSALDAESARALRGPQADARAYLLLRPWVTTAVRVDLADPGDPTPYWYVSSRHPTALAAAITAGTADGAGAAGPLDGAG